MFTIAIRESYPRTPEPPRPPIIERALMGWRDGSISDEDLERAFQRGLVETMAELIAAGIEVAGDCQIRTDDPVGYFCGFMSGFKVDAPPDAIGSGGLGNRTNGSGRALAAIKAIDKIRWQRPILLGDYRFMVGRSPVDVRPTLVGPLTIAQRCNPGVYRGREGDLIADISRCLNREMEGLSAAGARFFLIDEPVLGQSGFDSDLFLASSELLVKDIEGKVVLGCHGEMGGLAELLSGSAYHGFAFDLMDTDNNHQLVEREELWKDRILELGLVSGVNGRLETAMEVALGLVRYAAKHDPDLLWASPTDGMGGLGRALAFEKLSKLSEGASWARREIARREEPGGYL